jgi:hypothetical protein
VRQATNDLWSRSEKLRISNAENRHGLPPDVASQVLPPVVDGRRRTQAVGRMAVPNAWSAAMNAMLTQQIELAERIRLNYMANAFELIGGAMLPDGEQCVFARIRANAFSAGDAHMAFNIVRRRRREMIELAERSAPGDVDADHHRQWAAAAKSAADLALHQAESFMADLDMRRLTPPSVGHA